MKQIFYRMIFGVIVTVLVIVTGQVSADEIQQRMESRKPTIVSLKSQGIVGENNQGYLGFVKGNTEGGEVVAAENADRKVVYERIAKKNGTQVEMVGKLRAKQLLGAAIAGHWYQDANGKWISK